MPSFLCLTIRFLQPLVHGRRDSDEPEWPPSPLRVFQALTAAAAAHWNERKELVHAAAALKWLEAQPRPEIVAADATSSQVSYHLYMPNNTADLAAKSWTKGKAAKSRKPAEKDVRPTHLADDAVHYLYPIPADSSECDSHLPTLKAAARSITCVGWGTDMATGDAAVIGANDAAKLPGRRWLPAASGGTPLRVPLAGTLDDLIRKHHDFLGRLTNNGFRPVPPLKAFRVQSYRRDDDPFQRPFRVFELRTVDGSRFRYPPARFIHIAGMLRHLAIETMETSPPTGVPDGWVSSYVAGHAGKDEREHRQLSYLPLPSIGHLHTDPGVRRVMIAAPPGDEERLEYIARRLAGRQLRPSLGNEFKFEPPILVPVRKDNIARFYTQPARTWHSVTPVILPGHDDHKPHKTLKLVEAALAQSGIDRRCSFEWSALSRFPKSLSAFKYDKEGRPTGYIRPKHLLSQTAVHLTVQFDEGVELHGPLVIGAGRHCGFGLMAAIREESGG